MKHFNLSKDWKVRICKDGIRVFSPLCVEDKEYDATTDITLIAPVKPVALLGVWLVDDLAMEISGQNEGHFKARYKEIVREIDGEVDIGTKLHLEDESLYTSFCNNSFKLVQEGNFLGIMKGEDKSLKAIVTLEFPEHIGGVEIGGGKLLKSYYDTTKTRYHVNKHYYMVLLEENEEMFVRFGDTYDKYFFEGDTLVCDGPASGQIMRFLKY